MGSAAIEHGGDLQPCGGCVGRYGEPLSCPLHRRRIAGYAAPAGRIACGPPAGSAAAGAAITVLQHVAVGRIGDRNVAQSVGNRPGLGLRLAAGKDDLHDALELDRNEFREYTSFR